MLLAKGHWEILLLNMFIIIIIYNDDSYFDGEDSSLEKLVVGNNVPKTP